MDTPQLLLEHHLKALRLPTSSREYNKVARQNRSRTTHKQNTPQRVCFQHDRDILFCLGGQTRTLTVHQLDAVDYLSG